MDHRPYLSAGAVELHNKAKRLSSSVDGLEDHLAKTTHVLVAVRRHDADEEHWRSGDPQGEFLWIKARGKVTVRQIRESYLKQYYNEDPNLSVVLRTDNAALSDTIKAGDMDYLQDRVVVLTATQQPNSAVQGTPVDQYERGLAHRPGSQTSSQTPSRQPLQPINRQLTVPPMQSPKSQRSLKREDSDGSAPYAPRPQVEADQDDINERLEVPHHTQSPQGNHTPEPEPSQEYQRREYDDPFGSQGEEEAEPSTVRGQPLGELAHNTAPEKLEAGVKLGVEILDKLQPQLELLKDSPDAQNWIQQIEKCRRDAVKTRTVVGVVGNTGAGKSSVINAMLDEERLVPTNCMRACTAVVTELSYNDSKSDNSKYRAEVEFIQPEDWQKELNVLVEEAFDEEGHLVHEARNPDSQAGIAYAKIRAVYHKYTKEMLADATVESLMRVKNVQSILGTTKRINERTPEAFYKRLQSYVDSKEKGTEKLDKNGNKITNPKREFEHWPLIKVVKIYTKAAALATGAVIVDLPGVHDSNAARSAVAEGYMKQCTGLWIVAPINRAVDDKAAKSLLGDTFKRQLKYDGTYSAVTFICSKTDDISRTEAADSLQLGLEMDELDEKLSTIAKQCAGLSKQLSAAKANKKDHTDAFEAVDEEIETWEDLKSQLEDGKTVFAPSAVGMNKRKRASKSPGPRKRQRRGSNFDPDADSDYQSEKDDEDPIDNNNDASRKPLTEQQIDEKLDELRNLKKVARREKSRIEEEMRDLRKQISKLEDQEGELDARKSELCIAGRNEYSRYAIRQDFAAGIKELDQENAEEEDPDNFDPEEDIRDYDEVARSLPVFCVSSRAYQKLSGRMQKDSDIPGFTSKEQTEIPQLQSHCTKLTERGRQANCRRFLNNLNLLLSSLGLWASDDGSGVKLTSQQRDAERSFLGRRLKELEKALEKAVAANLEDITGTLADQLFDKFSSAIDSAIDEAIPTAIGWGGPRDAGGLHWSTYKATVRRQGVFRQDFNAQLTEPIYKQLATAWEKVFQRRLPQILQSFTKSGTDLLKQFHNAVETRCREKGHGVARLGLLANQLNAYGAIFNDMAGHMIANVNEGQREINREFTPIITQAMEEAYQICTDERGVGSYKRMKNHMATHVESNKRDMFTEACDQVRESLTSMCDEIRQQMLDRADGVFVAMQRDYMSIIGGVNINHVQIPREERTVRRELDDTITAADEAFQKVVDSNIDDLKEDVSSEQDIEVDEEGEDVKDEQYQESSVDEDEVSEEGEQEGIDEGNASTNEDEAAMHAEDQAGAKSDDDGSFMEDAASEDAEL